MNQVIRVASWNIGGGFTIDHTGHPDRENLQYFTQRLLDLRPDVICLQEVHILPTSFACPQVELIKKTLSLNYDAITPCDLQLHSHIDPTRLLALAIISRHPHIQTDYLILPNPNLEALMPDRTVWRSHGKAFMRATLQVGLTQIEIITGHAVPFHRFGVSFLDSQFEPIRSAIEEYILINPAGCIIFAGDLNHEDPHELLPKVLKAGFSQALPPGPTEPRSRRRHDHILVSNNCTVLSTEIITGHADHCLCFAEVSIQK